MNTQTLDILQALILFAILLVLIPGSKADNDIRQAGLNRRLRRKRGKK